MLSEAKLIALAVVGTLLLSVAGFAAFQTHRLEAAHEALATEKANTKTAEEAAAQNLREIVRYKAEAEANKKVGDAVEVQIQKMNDFYSGVIGKVLGANLKESNNDVVPGVLAAGVDSMRRDRTFGGNGQGGPVTPTPLGANRGLPVGKGTTGRPAPEGR